MSEDLLEVEDYSGASARRPADFTPVLHDVSYRLAPA